MEEPPPTEEVTTRAATEDVTLELVTPEVEAIDDVATKPLATEGAVEGAIVVEVISLDSPIKAVPRANRRKPMAISCLPNGLIDISHKPEHVQFWKDMGLYDFMNLDWDVKTGTNAQILEFIANAIVVDTVVDVHVINLIKDNLGQIFKLGTERADIAARARRWDSRKFSVAKDKNGYKLSHYIDPSFVERLDYMRITLYLQDRRNIITGVQVREAEEVRGGSTNWMEHFAGTFHHDIALSK
ncbi:unnamed protein product [Calypogeia fissa]